MNDAPWAEETPELFAWSMTEANRFLMSWFSKSSNSNARVTCRHEDTTVRLFSAAHILNVVDEVRSSKNQMGFGESEIKSLLISDWTLLLARGCIGIVSYQDQLSKPVHWGSRRKYSYSTSWSCVRNTGNQLEDNKLCPEKAATMRERRVTGLSRVNCSGFRE